MSKRTTLADRVLQYMKEFGSITSYEAFRELGVTRLSAAIFILKKKGIDICTKMEQSKNRYGDTVYFARYSLVEEEK